MKKDKATLGALMSKLKVETLPIVHRSELAQILRINQKFAVYKLPFDDYGDLLIDSEGLECLMRKYAEIVEAHPDFEKGVNPDKAMSEKEYDAYKIYLAIKAVREFIGV